MKYTSLLLMTALFSCNSGKEKTADAAEKKDHGSLLAKTG